MFLALLGLACGLKADHEPPSSLVMISNQDKDFLSCMIDLKVSEGD